MVYRHPFPGPGLAVRCLGAINEDRLRVLRQADANAANSDTIRVKVQKGSDGATLPGYTYTQDAQDF